MKKIVQILSAIVYAIGSAITLMLSVIFLSHSEIVLNPEAMLPMRLYEAAFAWLGFGAIPMVAACLAVCCSFDIFSSTHAKRKLVLIWMPGVICGCCAAVAAGVVIVGMARSAILSL